jgi:hypothetical protein
MFLPVIRFVDMSSSQLFKATKAAVPSTQGIIARSIILTVETNALTGHLTLVNPKD